MMDVRQLGEALWTLHLENIRAMDRIVEESRTRGETGLLMYLYQAGQPMYPGELTEKLYLTTGRIANILKSLDQEGLIVRTPDGADRRRVLVALTPRGEAVAREAFNKAVEYHARLISGLSEAEARAFMDMLRRMVRAAADGAARR